MIQEVTKLFGLPVYTPTGIRLGEIRNLELDIEKDKAYGICVGDTNPELVEKGLGVTIPFRWIQDIGEIVILKYFPEKVSFSSKREDFRY